jgi:predicted unusual protein kinase regulating ubiquinone biosynthesis (AarF/ABC1/UbiB family)
MILELGGFYLKVGQVFATKSDLLPPQYVAALKSVFDDCPPVPASKIDSILRKEFGNKPVSAVFKSFDTDALASATIAQVHVAHVDVDGKDTKVAVKVQNPGSERLMRMDMANMLFVSTLMDSLRV